MILSCNNLAKSFGVNEILKDITLNVNEKDKIALVGVNGAGKSTLFKILIGEIKPDNGNVIIPKSTNLAYFSQNIELDETNTVFNELLKVFNHIIELEIKLRTLEEKMSTTKDDDLDILLNEHLKISSYLNDNNLLDYNSKIKGSLKGLGFCDDDFYKDIKSLSGGQKTRVALCKILLKNPDILLLDEPTNHLDIKAIEWLEGFLKSYKKAILIISHDRYFLDNIINRVIEIENSRATIYNSNYSDYSIKKQINRDVMLKHFLNQQKDIKKQEETIKKLRSFNREKSIKRAESREKMLDRIEKVERPENLPNKMRITLTPKKESGNDVLRVSNLEKTFDDGHTLFRNISFEIKKGEKIALIGANGVGKTSLIKMILQNHSNVKIGANVNIAYYDQEQQNLNFNNSIFDEIAGNFPNLKNEEIRKTLAVFVFTGDDAFKNIASLSGGEKGRVALAKIMLSKANFLILDEPTNHLDILSKEILENALKSYTGTILYISHDRFFINNTATKVIELNKDCVDIYLGNYDYYLEKMLENKLIQAKTIETSITKLDWQTQKDIQREARKKENEITKIENKIAEVESKIANFDYKLSLEEVYTDSIKSREIFFEKTTLEKTLENLYVKWEKASEE